MLYLKLIIFIETIFMAWISFKLNRDIFSPVKIYILFSTFFYLAIYFKDVRWETLICYFVLIQSIAICIFVENKKTIFPINIVVNSCASLRRTIWLLSLPAVVTVIILIYDSGNLWLYLSNLNLRVEGWRGKGYLVAILNSLPALNLLYFASLLVESQRKISSILLYVFHFMVFFTMGLLTGSRSYIGITIIGMYVIWSYFVRPQKLISIALISILLVIFSGVIGAIRNNYNEVFSDGWYKSLIAGEKFEFSQISYGTNPLEIIFGDSEEVYGTSEKVFAGGSTYLSLLTNWLPRAIFPWKPDTGGIIFTEVYTDDHWEGLSILSPGAIAEAIMNFGIYLGIFLGSIFNLFILMFGCILYNSISLNSKKLNDSTRMFVVVSYFYIVLAFARFSYGEFTDIFQSLIFFSLMPLVLIWLLTRFKFKLF